MRSLTRTRSRAANGDAVARGAVLSPPPGVRAALAALAMLAVLAVLPAACGTPGGEPPTTEELQLADYGPPPVDVDGFVQRDVERRYSGITYVEVGSPVEAWYGTVGGLTERRDIRFGWAVRFKAYTISATALRRLAVDGVYFFRNGVLEGLADRDGFRFLE